MMRSLYSGISGLRNFQMKMDVIGNNIANVNTIAFKGSRVTFAETMAQTLNGAMAPTDATGGRNPIQVGLGLKTLSVDTDFSQGSLEGTGITTDMAIQGEGFFLVNDGNKDLYTRAGAFTFDADGNLVTTGNDLRVLGYMQNANRTGLDISTPQPLTIPIGRSAPAMATSIVNLVGNLDMNMTGSTATLVNADTTGVTDVRGLAANGVGGTHIVEVRGNNAVQSQASGDTQGLDLNDTLADHGVANVAGFKIVVDGDTEVELSGLSVNSTISELIEAINSQVSGVTAELDGNNAIQITRNFYGDGATYNVQLDDVGVVDGIVEHLFDGADPDTFDANNGTASTLVVTDVFTPNGETQARSLALDVIFDEMTGLVTGIEDLGNGGVRISAPEGLQAGDLTVETEDSTHSTSIFVYDSQGDTHSMTITFTRTVDNGIWQWEAEVPEPATMLNGGSGQLSFNDDGSLNNFTYDGNVSTLTFDPGNGSQNVAISIDAGTFDEFDGMTLSASRTSALAMDQDGFGLGTLQNVYIDNNGQIIGNYSNGVSETLAQILIANFTNPQGLLREGENLYSETINSGTARITEADQAGSKINSGFIEMSNVDLSREFTEMIVTQRAFQANARVITPSDQILQELNSLKR